MKSTIYIAAFLTLVLFSCKYEDGPNFSLLSKKTRVANIWFLDKVLKNGNDETDAFKTTFVNYKLEIKKDDTYTLTYRLLNISETREEGTWKFSDDKSKLILKGNGQTVENTWTILRLKNNSFWSKQKTGNDDYELRLKD